MTCFEKLSTHMSIPTTQQICLPKIMGFTCDQQGVTGNAFNAPDFTVQCPPTGKTIVKLGLGKFVASLLGKRFTSDETISWEIFFRACLAQLLVIKSGLRNKSLHFAWKALPNTKTQFVYGAAFPSPQLACERHMKPGKADETGALPLSDKGRSEVWYPFVGQNVTIFYFTEEQLSLAIQWGIRRDLEIKADLETKAALEKLAHKHAVFKQAIQAAKTTGTVLNANAPAFELPVEIHISPAVETDVTETMIDTETKVRVLGDA